jgi:hypothetical protein
MPWPFLFPLAPEKRRIAGFAASVIVVGVFFVNIYRAFHQSITSDEALTYDWYVVTPFRWMLTVYSANNHVLHTLLCRLSVKTLGLSEPALRLPSLFGGLLYLAFVYKLCGLIFENNWTFVLGVAALTLNPFVMDYLSAARGYGMGLGFFTAALYLVIRFFDGAPTAGTVRALCAGILLGLSVSANLVFIFPAVALAGVFTLLRLMEAEPSARWNLRLRWIATRIWLPFAIPAIFFLAVPLAHAEKQDFFYGKDSLSDTAVTVVQQSLFHGYDAWTPLAIPGRLIRSMEFTARWVIPVMLVLMFAVLVLACLRWWRARDFHRLNPLVRAQIVIGAVLGISLGMLLAAHHLAGILYPVDRTAIYLIVLLTLAWMALIEQVLLAPPFGRAIGLLASVPMAIAVILFVRGFTTSYYYEWRYEAGTKRIFHLLEGQKQFNAGRRIKVGSDWRLADSLDFYRQMYHADWMAKVSRDSPPETGGFDYYVLFPGDETVTRKLGLRVIYTDTISGQEVAIAGRLPERLSINSYEGK